MECFNCQVVHGVTTCNDCGFDYCSSCFLDDELHEPCEKVSKQKLVRKSCCKNITKQLCNVQVCHLPIWESLTGIDFSQGIAKRVDDD
jgi:hypothetical protein